MNNILFKQHNLELEFLNIDSRLQAIIYAMSGFAMFHFGKAITLTELFRTQQMQDKYYSKDEKYLINPWKSVHQYGKGADISVSFFKQEELNQINEYLNKTFKYIGTVPTASIHNVGYGYHWHLQVDNETKTSIIKI